MAPPEEAMIIPPPDDVVAEARRLVQNIYVAFSNLRCNSAAADTNAPNALLAIIERVVAHGRVLVEANTAHFDACKRAEEQRDAAIRERDKVADMLWRKETVGAMTHRFDVASFWQQHDRADKAERERDELREALARPVSLTCPICNVRLTVGPLPKTEPKP